MDTTTMTTGSIDLGALLNEQTVCLELRCSAFCVERRLAEDAYETEATVDKAMTRAVKKILESETLAKITTLQGQARRYIYSLRLSSSVVGGGYYLLTLPLIERVQRRLEVFRIEHDTLVTAFVDEYPAKIAEAEQRLGSRFNRDEYPSPTSIRGRFGMSWRWLDALNVPSKLGAVSDQLLREQRAEMQARMEQAVAEVAQGMRAGFAQLVSHFAEVLGTNEATGRKKRIHASTLDTLNDFFDTFAARNILNDTELDALVAKARKLANGVSPELLREDTGLRETLRAKFADLTTAATVLVDAPVRSIRFAPKAA